MKWIKSESKDTYNTTNLLNFLFIKKILKEMYGFHKKY